MGYPWIIVNNQKLATASQVPVKSVREALHGIQGVGGRWLR